MDDGEGGSGPVERRYHERTRVLCEVTLRRDGGSNYRVRLFDISQTGCKVEIIERFRVGEGVWVKFEGLETIHATASWIEPPVAGLRFERPMHVAVFDLLMRRLATGSGMS